MKRNSVFRVLAALLFIAGLIGGGQVVHVYATPRLAPSGLGSGFTYQGKLVKDGRLISDTCSMRFKLFDSEGLQVSDTLTKNVTTTSGLFTVLLDFGPTAFNGEGRVLDIAVQCPGDGDYVPLGQQAIQASPYALYAVQAGHATTASSAPWSGITGIPADIADGDANTTYTAGTGLSLVGTQFNVTTDTIQARVTGACAIGSTVRSIKADGSVACWPDGPFNRAAPPQANTVQTISSTENIGGRFALTIGSDGLPIIPYVATTPNSDLLVAHCADPACASFSPAAPTLLDTPGNIGNISIVTGPDGLGVMVYRRSDDGDVKVARCLNPECSDFTIGVVEWGIASYDVSITIAGTGRPLLNYRNGYSFDLIVANCLTADCSSYNTRTIDGTDDTNYKVGYWASSATGVDGMGLISYQRGDTGDLKVAHCNDLTCTATNPTVSVLDSANDTGYYTALVIGADGRGLISYVDKTANALRVAHCDDNACTTATLSTLDSVNMEPSFAPYLTAITIGADGLGLIVYYDQANSLLKAAHCTDLQCSSAAISTIKAVPPVAGDVLGLTIGVDGLPLVAYYDSADTDLKIIHCANAFCAPYFGRR
jgi:hypothetical protein